jgi:hypothetical protein
MRLAPLPSRLRKNETEFRYFHELLKDKHTHTRSVQLQNERSRSSRAGMIDTTNHLCTRQQQEDHSRDQGARLTCGIVGAPDDNLLVPQSVCFPLSSPDMSNFTSVRVNKNNILSPLPFSFSLIVYLFKEYL